MRKLRFSDWESVNYPQGVIMPFHVCVTLIETFCDLMGFPNLGPLWQWRHNGIRCLHLPVTVFMRGGTLVVFRISNRMFLSHFEALFDSAGLCLTQKKLAWDQKCAQKRKMPEHPHFFLSFTIMRERYCQPYVQFSPMSTFPIAS